MLNHAFFQAAVPLKYAKKEDYNDKKCYKIDEIPVGIAISEFYYYIVHKDCITILSKITEKVVKYYDVKPNIWQQIYFLKSCKEWAIVLSKVYIMKMLPNQFGFTPQKSFNN